MTVLLQSDHVAYRWHQIDWRPEGKRPLSRRALALTVTIQIRRYCNSNFTLWALSCSKLAVPVYLRVSWVLSGAFHGFLITETGSPCVLRSRAGCTRRRRGAPTSRSTTGTSPGLMCAARDSQRLGGARCVQRRDAHRGDKVAYFPRAQAGAGYSLEEAQLVCRCAGATAALLPVALPELV